VELSIERNNDKKYWDGDSWGDKETWLLASETTKWVLNCGGITWDSNFSYALKSRATDNAGNVERPTVITTTSTLQAPALISPANGTNVEYIPAFEWSYVLDSCYYIQIDNDSDFQSPEIDASYLTYNTYTPGEMGEGTYYWRVKAIDMERGYPESKWSEVWAVTILPSQPPDLEIVKKWENWVDKEKGTYTVSYVVHNNGTTVAPAGHHTTLYIDEEAVEHKPVPVTLKPCDTYEDTFKTVVKCTPPGDKITVCADNYDKVKELDEGNNCMTNVWQCPVPVRKPDLVIKDVKLSREGDYCYLDYLISNTGTVSAAASTTYLYVDDKKVASDSTSVLAAGASRLDRFTYRATGTHTFKVCADGPNAISESNEANNCRTEKLTCPPPIPVGNILYHANHGAGIWRMNPDGSGKTQLSDHGWFAEYSPDNTKIAFGDFYQNGIWVMNADGTNQKQLTKSGNAPTWSPDGKKIAYHDGDTEGKNRRIWVMNADGTNAHQLSKNPSSFPKWSPNGKKIAYHGEVNNGIWLINPDGTGETQLYKLGGYPAWSPGGKKIAYVSLTDWYIWTMNADGTGKTKLTDRKGIHPTWSSDATKIAYEDLANNKGIWVINADGSGDHMINKEGHAPDWSNEQ